MCSLRCLWPGGGIAGLRVLCTEKASIDEAFIDFTRPVREELLKRYPYLATVPPDAPNGLDSPLPPPPPISWDGKGTIVPVHPPKEKQDDAEGSAPAEGQPTSPGGEEDNVVEEDDEETTWHDVALSIAAELMMRIREDIRDKLGYTTSAVSKLWFYSMWSADLTFVFYRVSPGTSSLPR